MPYNPLLGPPQGKSGNPLLSEPSKSSNPLLSDNPLLWDSPSGRIYSGNLLSDIADTLSVPSYALAGLLQGKGVVEGVKNRANWVDYMREKYPQSNEPFLQVGNFRLTPSNTIGTALNVLLDPTWLIPPAKVGAALKAGAKAVGLTEAAAKAIEGSRLAGAVEKFTVPALGAGIKPSTRAALKTLSEIGDKAAIQESRLLEPALNVAREISKLTPEAQDLVSQYVEAGGAAARAAEVANAKDVLKKVRSATRSLTADAKARYLSSLTEAEKEALAQANRIIDQAKAVPNLTREQVLALAKSKGLNPDLIRAMGDKAIEADAAVGRALVDAGVISEDTFKAWEGQHLRRVYQRYEDTAKYIEELRKTDPAAAAELESTMKNMGVEAARSKAPSLRPKIPSGASAARKDLTLAERQALGEVTQAGYRLGKGAQMGALSASRANMLKSIASELGSDAYKAGYLKMPEGKAWGALSGKWVPDFVHAQLNEWVRRPTAFENASRKLWGYWKFGKTVANPATHVRNMLSNLLLADNAGLSPARVDIYAEALKDLASNGKWIQEAKKAGTAFIDTFAGRELSEFLNAINKTPGNVWEKAFSALSKVAKKMGDAYQFEEQWGKLAIYIFKRKQGLSPAEAAKAAEQWLFNYRKVPRWIENLRSGRLGPMTVPFATFSYKAIPAYAKALYENPARVARWFKYAQGVERTAVAKPGEIAQEGKVQPDWMKKGFWLRLPAKDRYGRSLYLDLNYIIPFNDAFQLSGLFGTGGTPAFASTPVIDLIQDLQRNQSRFTGRPIVPPGAVGNQAVMAYAKYLKDFVLPPLAGGYSFDKVKQSIMNVPDWRGRTTRLDVTLANVLLGLKTRPIDVNEERSFRIKEIQDQLQALRTNLYSIARDPKLSQQEKNRLWKQGLDAMNQLVAEASQLNQ